MKFLSDSAFCVLCLMAAAVPQVSSGGSQSSKHSTSLGCATCAWKASGWWAALTHMLVALVKPAATTSNMARISLIKDMLWALASPVTVTRGAVSHSGISYIH